MITLALAAQTLFVGAGGTMGRLTADGPGLPDHTGAMIAAEAGARFGMVSLGGRYAEGSLSNAAPGAGGLVQGEGRVGVTLGYITIASGPLAVSWADASRERWVFWTARARLSAPIVGDGVRSYIDAYHALAGSVNLPGDPSANGVTVGLDLGTEGVMASLSYEIGRLSSGVIQRNIELLSLTLRVGRP